MSSMQEEDITYLTRKSDKSLSFQRILVLLPCSKSPPHPLRLMSAAIPPNPQKQKGQPLRGQPLVVPRPPRERGGVWSVYLHPLPKLGVRFAWSLDEVACSKRSARGSDKLNS